MYRVASYNVHRCIGGDGRYDLDRVAGVVEELDCDVVALQELSNRLARGGTDQLAFLAKRGGYSYLRGPTRTDAASEYSNGLLHRGEPETVRRVILPVRRGREPRSAVSATFLHDGIRVGIVATHLGLALRERYRQARVLATEFESFDVDLRILAGDLNDWAPGVVSLRPLRKIFGVQARVATFPARWPTVGLDHVWVAGHLGASRLTAVRNPLTRVASDHLPLCAEITFPEALVRHDGAEVCRSDVHDDS